MKRKNSNQDFEYTPLEARNMLTGISFDAITGMIVFNGTSIRDVVRVNNIGNQIEVVYEGVETRIFEAADVQSIEFYGRNGSDTFDNNTSINSIAYGHLGNDNLYGGSGNDEIRGGKGNDDVRGNSGDDIVLGNNGDDMVRGGRGTDVVNGHAGDDVIRDDLDSDPNLISGGNGDDLIFAGDQSVVFGHGGNDQITGGAVQVFGGPGDDSISTGPSDSTIYGGEGNDEINSGAGNDMIFGGPGNDIITDLAGTNMIYGGSGDDHINASVDPPPINPNQQLLTENDIFGGAGNDTIIGGRLENRIFGGSGNDTIYGGELNDLLAGGDGFDEIFGNDGDDEIYGGIGHDYLEGEDGNDQIFGQNGNDHISGGNQNDQLYGGNGNDYLRGGDGDDILKGQDGNDRQYGARGDDLVFGGPGLDGLSGGFGVDVLIGGADSDRFLRRFFSDTIMDLNDIDAEIQFINGDGFFWTTEETQLIDDRLQTLHFRTQNNKLLKDPLASSLAFRRDPIVSFGTPPRFIQSVLSESSRIFFFENFDASDPDMREYVPLELIREFGRVFASDAALNTATQTQNNIFTRFQSISGWTQQPPNDTDYVLGLGNIEYYLATATFVDDPLAIVNSKNDFASTWRAYFTPGADLDLISEKVDILDQLFTDLSL